MKSGWSLAAVVTIMCLALVGGSHAQESEVWKEAELVRLTISPSAAPRPELMYYLLPRFTELKRGSAYPFYARLTKERNDSAKEHYYKAGDLLERPLNEAAGKEISEYVRSVESVTDQIRFASTRTHCEWEYPLGEVDTFSIMLPDVNEIRMFYRIVAIKARHEIATRQFDQAVDTLLTGFAMARHIDDGPFLVHDFVAVDCAKIMLEQLRELISSTDSPNMYWALTSLRQPLIDIRPSILFERELLELTVPEVTKLDSIKSEEDWTRLARRLIRIDFEARQVDTSVPFDEQARMEQLRQSETSARRYLLREGIHNQIQLDAMSTPEVLVRWMVIPYLRDRDALFKWCYVQPWQIPKSLREKKESRPDESLFASIFLHWPIEESVMAPVGVEQQIAGLRIVEAIRMYLAEHNRLPANLAEIKQVPIPDDPATGTPFEFRFADGEITLRSSLTYRAGVNYRITVR
jgi:hypothetical protein